MEPSVEPTVVPAQLGTVPAGQGHTWGWQLPCPPWWQPGRGDRVAATWQGASLSADPCSQEEAGLQWSCTFPMNHLPLCYALKLIANEEMEIAYFDFP